MTSPFQSFSFLLTFLNLNSPGASKWGTGTTKWQTGFFPNKHLYKITNLGGGCKKHLYKITSLGGGCKKHLYKITNLGGGVQTTTSPTSTSLGSPLAKVVGQEGTKEVTWSCLDGGLLSHLLGAFWPFRTDGFWCMGLPWHYKMANQFFSRQTPLQNHRPGKRWCKKTPLQNHKPGGGGAKKSKQHPYKITNLGGGVRTTTSPTSTFLGSPLGSFWVLFYQFLFSSHTSKINQNNRTRDNQGM